MVLKLVTLPFCYWPKNFLIYFRRHLLIEDLQALGTVFCWLIAGELNLNPVELKVLKFEKAQSLTSFFLRKGGPEDFDGSGKRILLLLRAIHN